MNGWGKMNIKQYRDNFYILDNGGVWQFLIIGKEQSLLIDTGFSNSGVADAVKQLTETNPTVILTHGDSDHAEGLTNFKECYIHQKDMTLVQADVVMHPVKENDIFEVGSYSFKVIEIPGHTYGSIALWDKKNRILLPGDSVQIPGPIYMFGSHRNLDLYLKSLKKLCALPGVETVIPCHNEYPLPADSIKQCLEDALSLKRGELKGEKHPSLPCCIYKGKWTSFYF